MKTSISIVLATRNGEPYLRQQLNSIKQQTLRPRELIISDDNSTDTTLAIAHEFSAIAGFPVRIVRNEPALGFRENFLSATALATGEWVAFCDQDDVWRADKLQMCANASTTEGVTQIVHQSRLIDASNNVIGTFDQGIKQNSIVGPLKYDIWGTFWGFSMIVKRSLLALVPPSDRFVDYIDARHLIAHDRWAFFLAQTLGRTAEIAEPLADYRQHGNNLYGGAYKRGVRKTREIQLLEHAVYVDATRGMLSVVEGLPDYVERDFPRFDRIRALQVYSEALRQVEARLDIYKSGRIRAPFKSILALTSGKYRNAHCGNIRWRSFGKDLLHATFAA